MILKQKYRKWIMLSLLILGMCIIIVNNKPIATNNSPDIDIYKVFNQGKLIHGYKVTV
jgi:hypothetical protein